MADLILNDYAKVVVLTSNSATLSTTEIYPGQPPVFHLDAGDPILLMTMSGYPMRVPGDSGDPSFGDDDPDLADPPWNYVRVVVTAYDPMTNSLEFTPSLPSVVDLAQVDVQLIKIWTAIGSVTLTNRIVSWGYRHQPGSGTGAWGGVVAIEVVGDLTLQAGINVVGCGYVGGSQSDAPSLTENQHAYYYATSLRSRTAGNKGQGLARIVDSYRAGRGKALNAGGGGNARRAGGGGGAAYGAGGSGGPGFAVQDGVIVPNSAIDIGGFGGLGLREPARNRLILGGGGGGGAFGDVPTGSASAGGSGGGIVYLVVSGHLTLNTMIDASGQPAAAGGFSGPAGSGGGGGGGSIYIRAGSVSGSGILKAAGGEGGSGNVFWRASPGGGGGGGLIDVVSPIGAYACGALGGAAGASPINNPELVAGPGQSGKITWDHSPIANNAAILAIEDQPMPITLTATSDLSLNYAIVRAPEHGQLAQSGSSPQVVYTPEPDYNGADSFTFRAWSGPYQSNEALVFITVAPEPEPPHADDQFFYAVDGEAIDVTLVATDPDTETLTYTITLEPEFGALQGEAPNLRYVSQANYTGLDHFTWMVSDGNSSYGAVTTTISVAALHVSIASIQAFPGCQGQVTVTLQNLGTDAAQMTNLEITDAQGDVIPWFQLNDPTPVLVPAGGEAQVVLDYELPNTPQGPYNLVCRAEFGPRVRHRPFVVHDGNEAGTLTVLVRDQATQQPITGALLSVDNCAQTWSTGPDGRASLAVGYGQRTVYAFAPGHLPDEAPVAHTTPNTQLTIALAPGQPLSVSGVSVTQIGPIPGDPNGYFEFEFIAYTTGTPITVIGAAPPSLPPGGIFVVPLPGGTGTITVIGPPAGSGAGPWPVSQCPQAWLLIPGGVRVRKQYFSATVVLANASSYPLESVEAGLLVPAGIALPAIDGSAQLNPKGPWTIGAGGVRQCEWIVRGDVPGSYALTAHAAGSLTLGGVTHPLTASFVSPTFTVARPSFDVAVSPPEMVEAGQPFEVGFDVINRSTEVALEDVSIYLRSQGLLHCTLAPDETEIHQLGDIPIGGVGHTVFHFISQVTGTVAWVARWVSSEGAGFQPVLDVAPIALGNSARTYHDHPVTIDVLSNDADPDGSALTIGWLGTPGHGSVEQLDDGQVRYTPAPLWSGVDTFGYRARDVAGNLSNEATVTVTVTLGPPTANPQTVTVLAGQSVAITLTASNPDNVELRFDVDSKPSHGVLEGEPPHLIYTHQPLGGPLTTPDAFTFHVDDGQTTSSAEVTINVEIPGKWDPADGGGDTM